MSMNRKTTAAAFLAVVLTLSSVVQAAEYFVSKDGNDANDGASREAAFLTIQKGVDALKPGDTLTIGPGEYFESVKRDNLGGSDADTVIRAEIPGMVLLRGDVPVSGFIKVEGRRFVYAAPFRDNPRALLEHDTLRIQAPIANRQDIEYEPGSCYYDAGREMLYMSTSNLREPRGRRLTAVVADANGLAFSKPRRVIIEGLAVSGFYPNYGMDLGSPVGCVVRGCLCYMNYGGIRLTGGSDNVVENCLVYGNERGGVMCYRGNNFVIRNCRAYKNTNTKEIGETFGIMHYHSMSGPIVIKDCISWGQNFNLSVKPNDEEERLENCVGLGFIRISTNKMSHNVIGGSNEYDRDSNKAPADTILFLREKNLDKDFEFADPLNLDFRLQADSSYRGRSPGGGDAGAYEYKANVFYVSPTGDDNADGLSMRKPWRTLERALRDRRPADTVYLAEGQYAAAPLEKLGDAEAPVRILGRGRETVVITGTLNAAGCAGVVFERLNFADGVSLNDSSAIEFRNCTFFGNADGLNAEKVGNLRVAHSVFMDAPLSAKGCAGVFLSGNIYANSGKPAVRVDTERAIRYSDYNNYGKQAECWNVNGAMWSLADVQERHDRYSQTLTPQFVMEGDTPRLVNSWEFKGRGPHSTALGIHHEYDATPEPLELVRPVLHSTSDTTANIEWWTSRPATFELAWGETPEMTNKVKNFDAPERFTTFSLTGLKPDTTYYFSITSADTTGRSTAMDATILEPGGEPLAFKTRKSIEPATYYVATDGSNANSGRTRGEAWRTLTHAAETVNAGDTVLIAGGSYNENVRIHATGDKGKPITFKCVPGEKVFLVCKHLPNSFRMIAKKYINLDGLYFGDSIPGPNYILMLWRADNVRITRCFCVKGINYAAFLLAEYCENLLVKNCVVAHGMSPYEFYVCPGWRMENNVILEPFVYALNFVNKPDQPGYLKNNVICDNLYRKVREAMFAIGRFESLVDDNNCYFLRVPDGERRMFFFYGTAAYSRYAKYGITTDFDRPPVIRDHPDGTPNNVRMSLEHYKAVLGRDTGSYVGDPLFAGAKDMPTDATHRGTDLRKLSSDMFIDKPDLDFPDLFATHPQAVEKDVGLQPEAFKDFRFSNKTQATDP